MERKRFRWDKLGQSTMEYVIVLVAIIAAILFAATTFLKPAVTQFYNSAGTGVNASAALFENNVGASVTGLGL